MDLPHRPLHILSRCNQLRHATIRRPMSGPHFEDTTQGIIASSLTSLDIEVSEMIDIALLSHLTLPSLSSLKLSSSQYTLLAELFPLADFAAFLTQSDCTLDTLVFTDIPWTTLAVLRLLPSLHKLLISNEPRVSQRGNPLIADKFFSQLQQDRLSFPSCRPCLGPSVLLSCPTSF
ncbi:hypothetical protein C8J56DRAFT_220128 [Mycena floridula]|nr:hypothetical protein C8J56DRAFT_220128 [Mycena floridula]